MWLADKWEDYRLLDCSGGERLESWGGHILIRPDPQVIWQTPKTHPDWRRAAGKYTRSSSGGGAWDKARLPESWRITYPLEVMPLHFNIKPMNFKHTGIFPEQAANWSWFSARIAEAVKTRPVEVLNLFAYTGGATLAAAAAGASVCHVDAARGMVAWGRENAALSGLADRPIRWIIDDCVKFLQREIRRGKKYDCIIMDPPSYGRGPGGEIWKLEEQLYPLIKLCAEVLSDDPLFVLVNSYTSFFSPSVAAYILSAEIEAKFGGHTECGELGLPVGDTGRALPCGSCARWTAD
ncbi:MAG: class I SAM-dependent methyltransferase [Clostridia bacterium]|nr:class I SAM-dependent methyltransferase [Clostridia bacterium]